MNAKSKQISIFCKSIFKGQALLSERLSIKQSTLSKIINGNLEAKDETYKEFINAKNDVLEAARCQKPSQVAIKFYFYNLSSEHKSTAEIAHEMLSLFSKKFKDFNRH